MICPACKAHGVRSNVYPGFSSTTLMGGASYWDTDGRYHSHDPNTTTTDFRCSQGHEWTEHHKSPCPSCNYGRQQ